MSPTYELFHLVSEVMTLLYVVAVVPIEMTILRQVPELSWSLHGVGRPQEPLFFDLEEDLRPGRVKRGRERSSVGWLWPIEMPFRDLQRLPQESDNKVSSLRRLRGADRASKVARSGGESPRSLNNLQYMLGVWDGVLLSKEGGKEVGPPRPRT
ncbi:hypothetical protein BHM03_00038933 [Ensete ventricosum]|nr:hypothetical protein BHM03_00038933 [Ensete ventricosum]